MSISPNPGNQEFILSLKEGREEAFRALYRQYQSKLFRYCFRFVKSKDLADDLVQTIFVKIWTKRKTLVAGHSFDAFLFRVAKNVIFDYFRGHAAESSFVETLYERIQWVHNHPEEQILYNDLQNVVREVVDQLPEQRRKIFRMSREQGMSYDEIAKSLSISPNTVKEQVARALRFIREQLVVQADLSLILVWAVVY
ncbi:MAG: RNA polymerase sigma-70 factor [Cytophagales bacterium]|nr:RNA polymerase sigma-70 factor [Cytophagales bacterium]